MYSVELEVKESTESNTFASYLDLLKSSGRNGQLHNSFYDKLNDFSFHITNFPFLSSNIPSSTVYGVFISQLIRCAMAWWMFYSASGTTFMYVSWARICQETFEIVPQGVLRPIWNIIKHYEAPSPKWLSGTWWYIMAPSIDQIFH